MRKTRVFAVRSKAAACPFFKFARIFGIDFTRTKRRIFSVLREGVLTFLRACKIKLKFCIIMV